MENNSPNLNVPSNNNNNNINNNNNTSTPISNNDKVE